MAISTLFNDTILFLLISYGMFLDIPEEQYPSERWSVGLFSLLGANHAVFMNWLQGRRFYNGPLHMAFRTVMGGCLGYAVHHTAPMVRQIAQRERDFERQVRAWQDGVRERRKKELELSGMQPVQLPDRRSVHRVYRY